MSFFNGIPMRHWVLLFLTNPELVSIAPGVHIPTDVSSPVFAFNSLIKDMIDFTIES